MKKEILDRTQSSRTTCFAEENLEQEMEQTAEPYLKSVGKSGWLEGVGKETDRLYYELYLHEKPKGTIVISYGFTESCLKYHELIYYFHREGYQVAIMDHRGHGRSAREVQDVTIVHIDLFTRYVKDLRLFVRTVVKPAAKDAPLFLVAHSMGGCIGAFYLEQYPHDFDRAVLNAPMLGLKLGLCPGWAARILCDLKVMEGNGKERLFTQSPFDPEEPFEESSSSSRYRHAYYMKLRRERQEYQTSSASYYWGKEAINAGHFVISRSQANKVKTPVLLFQAGEDSLVKPSAHRKFISGVADGRLVLVPGVRHEIYRAGNEILKPWLEEIYRFFEAE